MKINNIKIHLLFVLLVSIHCNKSPNEPNNNSPSDHKINKGGSMHKAGYSSPLDNCTSCHGDDLKGGSSGISCYKCHGKEW